MPFIQSKSKLNKEIQDDRKTAIKDETKSWNKTQCKTCTVPGNMRKFMRKHDKTRILYVIFLGFQLSQENQRMSNSTRRWKMQGQSSGEELGDQH